MSETKIPLSTDRRVAVDITDPQKVETMRRFILGSVTVEEAGPGFTYGAHGDPLITINRETFETLKGITYPTESEDHIIRGEN